MNTEGKKYWILTTEFPPFHGGGISTYCYHTTRMFSERGYNVSVFIFDKNVSKTTIEIINSNLKTIRFTLPVKNVSKYLSQQGKINYRFLEVILEFISKEGKPDFIESQDYLGLAYYILLAKHTLNPLLANSQVIITLHTPAFVYLPYNSISTYKIPTLGVCEMEKHSIIGADILIAPSVFIKNLITRELNLQNREIAIIKNPFQNDRTELIQHYNKTSIAYLGKLSKQKGCFFLLDSMKQLWNSGSNISLTLIGSRNIVDHSESKTMDEIVRQDYKKYIDSKLLLLKDKINTINLKKISIPENFIIFPSSIDNLPYVIIEMMSLGKIVLASKNGGQSEIIEDDKTGFLFCQDSDAFLKVLKRALNLSDNELNAISKNAINYIEQNFSYESIFSEKDSLLNTFLSKGASFAERKYPFRYQEPISYSTFSNQKKLLSIVIPYYNLGLNIKKSIESILKSNYPNIEIIIVNDGTTDRRSLQTLSDIGKTNPQITILHQENMGLSQARNAGALQAKGEFLTFLDADDRVSTSYYQKAISILSAYDNVFFVGSWIKFFNRSKEVWPSFNPQPPFILLHNTINSSALVYRRDAFLSAGLNKPQLKKGFEDYESIIHLLSKGLNGVVIPEIHYYYQVRKKSMFRKMTKSNKIHAYEFIHDQHKDLYKKYSFEIINILNANGPGYQYETQEYEIGTLSFVVRTLRNNTFANYFLNSLPKVKKKLLQIYRSFDR